MANPAESWGIGRNARARIEARIDFFVVDKGRKEEEEKEGRLLRRTSHTRYNLFTNL